MRNHDCLSYGLEIQVIYQYTTIEALAQILKNQTIRFTRLDKVDDLEEGRIESQSIKLSKHLFVSCWTEERDENIPLWKMYAGDRGGVRIGLDVDMFREYYVDDLMLGGEKATGSAIMKLPRDELMSSDYFVLPIFNANESPFFRKVEYVDSVERALSGIVHKKERVISVLPNGDVNKQVDLSINMHKVGAVKHSRWSFEAECRFTLMILKGNPYINPTDKAIDLMLANLVNEESVDFTYYDMHLSPSAFDNMEITMSPSSLPGQRIIVESLCTSFAPKAIVRDSDLRDLVKLK